MKAYFFDSYALFEIIFGNKEYVKLTHNTVILTTRFNLLELHYHLLVRRGLEDADKAYDAFKEFIIEPDDHDIRAASVFRKENQKRKVSFIDCVGYSTAKNRGALFLTGDDAFRGLENVEFVK